MSKKNISLKTNPFGILFLFIASISIICLGFYLSKYGQGFYDKYNEWVDTASARALGVLTIIFGFFFLIVTTIAAFSEDNRKK